MINCTTLLGRLGQAPELKTFQRNGKEGKIARASLVTWDWYDGQEQNVEWHRLVFWNTYATNAAKLLRKGTLVHITGRMHYSQYEDKDGVKRTKAEIFVNEFRPVFNFGQKKDQQGRAGQQQPGSVPQSDFTDDDIPF